VALQRDKLTSPDRQNAEGRNHTVWTERISRNLKNRQLFAEIFYGLSWSIRHCLFESTSEVAFKTLPF